jgi:hypothetical protein
MTRPDDTARLVEAHNAAQIRRDRWSDARSIPLQEQN